VIFLLLPKHNGRIYIQSKVCAWPGHGAHIIRAVVINLMAKVARWKTFQIKASRNSGGFLRALFNLPSGSPLASDQEKRASLLFN
jgi:hypothetical protein